MNAIEFAQNELAPRGEENVNQLFNPSKLQPEFLEELEKTMALLVYDDTSANPASDLFDVSHRQKVATELNAAILTSFCQDKDPKLPSMLKMLSWAQDRLSEKVLYPKITDFSISAIDSSTPMDTSGSF